MTGPSFQRIRKKDVESETHSNEVTKGLSQSKEASMKEEKEKQQEEEIISLTRYFIEIDLTEKLFHILASKNKRS